MFTADQKAGFSYTIAHALAYNATALSLGCWKPKYIFHDWEKPWMMLIAKYILRKKEPYKWVREWHRTHRRHHVQYYRPATMNHDGRHISPIETIIDWECSRFTKESSPETAYEYYMRKHPEFPTVIQEQLKSVLKQLNLWKDE